MIERTVLKSGKIRWRVRYRTPDARQRTATFDHKADAEAFKGRPAIAPFAVVTSLTPQRGRIKLHAPWDEFESADLGHLRQSTRQNYRMASRNFLDHFGARPDHQIEHADVAAWVTKLSGTGSRDGALRPPGAFVCFWTTE